MLHLFSFIDLFYLFPRLPTLLDPLQEFLHLSPNRNNVFVILEEHTLYFVMEMMVAKKYVSLIFFEEIQ